MFRKFAVFSLLFPAMFFVCSLAVSAQMTMHPPTLVTESVNENKLVTLAGSTHPRATAQNDQGPLEDGFAMENLWLQLKRSPEQQAALDRYTEELFQPSSPNFQKWLTGVQFGQQFGVAQEDIDAVSQWLQSHGLTVSGVGASRTLIAFSGTARQVSEAFHTSIHHLVVNGAAHIANMSDLQIPSALAPAVAGVVKMNNFVPRAMHTKPEVRGGGISAMARPNYTFGTDQFVAPADLATIYSLNPLFQAGYTGKGQTIAVLEDSDLFSASDWTQFRKNYGLTRPYIYGNFRQVHPSSGALPCADPGATGDDFEAVIDAQWASAAAPNASIVLASCANTFNFGPLIALQNMLDGSAAPPAIVSISYGGSEAEQGNAGNAYINALYQQAAVEGVSLFVSSGDSGADNNETDRQNNVATTGISVNGLGSTPYNVSVGGTDYEDTYFGETNTYWKAGNTGFFGSAKSYIPEIPWNQSCGSTLVATSLGYATTYGRSGFCNSSYAFTNGFQNVVAASGGPSVIYAKPSWQSVHGNPSDGVRDLPDVSLFAASGPWGHAYVACYSAAGFSCAQGYFYDSGGTSFATPIMAGIQALVNEKTGRRAGNPNPTYYSLARSEYGATGNSTCNSSLGNAIGKKCIFNDVTQGDIDVFCKGTVNCFTAGTASGVLSVKSSHYQPAYPAGSGWDFATGIGSMNAYNLVMNWPITPQAKTE